MRTSPSSSPKPGLFTTEFYGCNGFAGGCITIALTTADRVVAITALIAGALSVVGYAISRALSKQGANQPPHQETGPMQKYPPLSNNLLLVMLSLAAALLLAGCATTDQKQPTAQEQPQAQKQSQAQKDEQAANVAIVQQNNTYPGLAVPDKPGEVKTDKDGWYAPVGETAVTAKITLPDGRVIESRSTVTVVSSQSVEVTTHGQSDKSGTGTAGQTGGSQGANTQATATPTNDVKPQTDISVPAVP